MTFSTADTESSLLFSFGTLLLDQVQQQILGGPVASSPDELLGHGITEVVIEDPAVVELSGLAVHRGLARQEGARVPGGVLTLTPDQLQSADAYEVAAYTRRRVSTAVHGQVWAYVDAYPLQAAQRVAVIGDSIAYGLDCLDGGWSARLGRDHISRDQERNRFFNLAIPGLTLHELAGIAADELRVRRADTVLVSAGVNDLIDGATPQDVVTSMDRLCSQVESLGARPVALGPLWNDEDATRTRSGADLQTDAVAELDTLLQQWGSGSHRDVLSLFTVLQDQPSSLTDGLHPTPQAHRVLYEVISAGLVGPSALISSPPGPDASSP